MNIKSLIIIILCCINFSMTLHCFWNEDCHYNYFSSKTPYNLMRGDIRDSLLKLKDCEPISIWGLIRHGKRNPGIDFRDKMLKALVIRDFAIYSYEMRKSSICAQDIENLRNWQINKNMFEKVHHLSDEGYNEIVGIGHRLKEAFVQLLSDIEDGSYKIRSAYGHWIEDGVKGFITGLQNPFMIIEETNSNNDIIAPYEACNKYIKKVRKNPKIYAEVDKYQNSSEYRAMKERIQNRTGIESILTNENITSLYDLCRYTWSEENKPSPWCVFFTKEDLHVLEYIGDLRHYYRNSYGTAINEVFGRIPLADLLQSFRKVKAGVGKKMTMYFSHATMMDMVYAALGLFKDKNPLRATFRDPNRMWRSSKLSPFAANLLAVLHRCGESNTADYKVTFYLNEKPLGSICKNGICSWNEFEKKLKTFVNTTLDFC